MEFHHRDRKPRIRLRANHRHMSEMCCYHHSLMLFKKKQQVECNLVKKKKINANYLGMFGQKCEWNFYKASKVPEG